MKRILFSLFLGIIISASLFSAKPIVPPGTVKVNDSLYVDKSEIRNLDYLEFVSWMKKYGDDTEECLSILPDTTVWVNKKKYNKPLKDLYFRHPSYNQYPVVGISYENAVKYCEWRTDRVNEFIHVNVTKIHYDSVRNMKDIPKYVQYRLPTVEEWEYVANQPYADKTLKRMNKKKHEGIRRTNLNTSDDMGMAADRASIPAPVSSYWPNQLGVYNIIGNVAEMTSEKGVAKGGSWSHKPEEVSVETEFNYEKPESWLGFRCVCDVLIGI